MSTLRVGHRDEPAAADGTRKHDGPEIAAQLEHRRERRVINHTRMIRDQGRYAIGQRVCHHWGRDRPRGVIAQRMRWLTLGVSQRHPEGSQKATASAEVVCHRDAPAGPHELRELARRQRQRRVYEQQAIASRKM